MAKSIPRRFDDLVASGVIRPPLESGDPTEGWSDIRLPAGTGAELIDAERGADAPLSIAETSDVRYTESSALIAALLESDSGAFESVRTSERKVTSADYG